MTTQRRLKSLATGTAAFIPADRLARQWLNTGLAVLAGTAIVVTLLSGTATAMAAQWGSSTYGYGLLIAPVSAYLVWRRRAALAAIAPEPHWLGVAGMVAAAFGWMLGYATGTLLVQELALVAAIQALVFAVLGWKVVRLILFPLLYLYFAVPFGEELIPHLQRITAFFVVDLLQYIGVPVFSDGTFISIPTGNFVVAEACAGLRYLLASVALGAVFANVMYRTWWRRLTFVCLSVAIPVVANGIRAFGIVALAYFSDNQLAVGIDHLIYGWLFYSFVTVLLLLFGMRLREPTPKDVMSVAVVERGPARSSSNAWLVTALSVVLMAGALAYVESVMRVAVDAHISGLARPMVSRPWRAAASVPNSWAPVFPGASSTSRYSYLLDEARVDLFIGYYKAERQGAEAVSSTQRFANGHGWRVVQSGSTAVMFDRQPMTVGYHDLAGSGVQTQKLVYYWYWIGGEETGDPYLAKLLKARSVLLQYDPSAAVVAVATDYKDRPTEAAAVLKKFLGAMAPLRRGGS